MSIKELERVLAQVVDKKISQTAATKKLKVCDRQFRRANRTLQDRLVKYLRLKGISSIEEGNKIL